MMRTLEKARAALMYDLNAAQVIVGVWYGFCAIMALLVLGLGLGGGQ